jgi:urease accessory protein
LALRITVRAGATLRLRTAAASVALPGPDGGESLLAVTASVEQGGCLEYLPEPVVVADGARHATDLRVILADGARLLLREELILGRHGERGGRFRAALHVTYAGRPLLRQSLEVSGDDGPCEAAAATRGPAVLSGHRAAGTLLHVDPVITQVTAATYATTAAGVSTDPPISSWAAVMPLAGGPATLTTALADDAVTLRQHLSRTGQ